MSYFVELHDFERRRLLSNLERAEYIADMEAIQLLFRQVAFPGPPETNWKHGGAYALIGRLFWLAEKDHEFSALRLLVGQVEDALWRSRLGIERALQAVKLAEAMPEQARELAILWHNQHRQDRRTEYYEVFQRDRWKLASKAARRLTGYWRAACAGSHSSAGLSVLHVESVYPPGYRFVTETSQPARIAQIPKLTPKEFRGLSVWHCALFTKILRAFSKLLDKCVDLDGDWKEQVETVADHFEELLKKEADSSAAG